MPLCMGQVQTTAERSVWLDHREQNWGKILCRYSTAMSTQESGILALTVSEVGHRSSFEQRHHFHFKRISEALVFREMLGRQVRVRKMHWNRCWYTTAHSLNLTSLLF